MGPEGGADVGNRQTGLVHLSDGVIDLFRPCRFYQLWPDESIKKHLLDDCGPCKSEQFDTVLGQSLRRLFSKDCEARLVLLVGLAKSQCVWTLATVSSSLYDTG